MLKWSKFKDDKDRLLQKTVIDTNGCWNWTASIQKHGYGHFGLGGKIWLAHRAAYTLLVGPIPNDKQIDHLCRNRRCVNPEHLELVTGKENCHRGISFAAVNARKTHCSQGHEFTPENTYRWKGAPFASRACKICIYERSRKGRAA